MPSDEHCPEKKGKYTEINKRDRKRRKSLGHGAGEVTSALSAGGPNEEAEESFLKKNMKCRGENKRRGTTSTTWEVTAYPSKRKEWAR